MEKLRVLIVFSICIFLFSCQKDFTVTTPKEESYAVYCILNLKDTANYVRINRVFTSENDPGDYEQNPDSVNIKAEDFKVTLLPFFEEAPEDTIVFYPSSDRSKEDGLFATENYQTFKTKQQLLPGREYYLTVKNKVTGFEMHAQTELLGGRILEYSFKEVRHTSVNMYTPETIDYDGDLGPGQWDKQVERFLYYEYSGDEVRMKFVDYRSNAVKSLFETGNIAEAQLSDDFLKNLASEIKVDTSVYRVAVGVDRILLLNDEDLTVIIDYCEDHSSGQFLPVFSNFDRGVGILASRYFYTSFAMKLKDETLDTIAHGRFTGNLGFVTP